MRKPAPRRTSGLGLLRGSSRLLQKHGLAAELHTILLVDSNDLHPHNVADPADISHTAYIFSRQLADMAEAVFAGNEFNEGAKVLHARHPTLVDAANLDRRGECFDLRHGSHRPFRIVAGHRHRAVILDLDAGAGRLLNGTDRLAARTDQEADLLGVDVGAEEPRRPLRNLGPWPTDG